MHEEHQYLNLIKDVINTGFEEQGRNGKTIAKFGTNMRFSLKDGLLPLLTTKKMAYKSCFKELFWFISGNTSNDTLMSQNVKIWQDNSSREFLDSVGLVENRVGDLGPVYGFQWRHFNADYSDCDANYDNTGIDQLQQIIDNLKDPKKRNSRRHILTAWNPCQINKMALPPCHLLCQFNVHQDKYLSCALYQRSGDVGLGIPFNTASYALLTHIIATHCELEAYEFVHFIGNTHIYEEHKEPLIEIQCKREPKSFPRILIKKQEKIEDYSMDSITWITPYESHDTIKMKMIV